MNFNELEKRLGYAFSDKQLLEQALTHPSMSYESKKKIKDNQRMEFLGDAVLQLSLTICLYHRFPEMQEGNLTKLRAQVVSRTTLARVARTWRLGEFLILGRGEEMNKGRERASNLADAVEAIISAVYQDSNFETAHQWLKTAMEPYLEEVVDSPTGANPKGELQEWFQGKGQGTPIYETLEETGPDHARSYTVVVKVNGQEFGRGQGASKRAAETEAAAQALKKLP